ncbi:YhgE/Pip domain-containing protein [Streptomyces sp. NPDC020192]|uniref:YhgE/Pip domain-containing protein n=1 Tax=Streptomyces sp. NPDC020192 TaxID=3365066 RepID=UPI0037BC3E1A
MSGNDPFRVLHAKPLWITNGVITGVLALLFTVLYVGANIDPVDHMKKLPVGLVNADKGVGVGGKRGNLGVQITESIKKSTASGSKIDWKVMDEKEVKEELGEGKLYGALVVPADFTTSITALTGTATTGTPVRPTLTVLTNQSVGSLVPAWPGRRRRRRPRAPRSRWARNSPHGPGRRSCPPRRASCSPIRQPSRSRTAIPSPRTAAWD